MKKAVSTLVFASALLAASTSALASPNLVVNGSFETGDLTGFTLSGNTGPDSYTYVGTAQDFFGVTPTDGTYELGFGAILSPAYLTQTIATVAGDSYVVSFDVDNLDTVPNSFDASFGGVDLLNLTDAAAFPYTTESFVVVATGSSSVLQFAVENDQEFYFLDNVSVTGSAGPPLPPPPPPAAVPEPGVWAMMIVGLGMVGITMRRRQAAPLAQR